MNDFSYRARTQSGRLTYGVIAAKTADAAANNLKEKGYLLLSLSEVKKDTSFPVLPWLTNNIPASYVTIFSRQLSALLKAGIPFSSSLETIREQVEDRRFRLIINDLIEEISRGNFFSEALSRHEAVFGKIYIGMIKTAETSGSLEEILERLAILGEQEEDVKAQIKSATMYPIIVVGALGIAFLVLVTVVVPKFIGIFSQFQFTLPLPTRLLIGLHHFLSRFWWFVVGLMFVAASAFKVLLRAPRGQVKWDEIKLKIPVIGNLILKIMLSRFARVMSILTRTGVPIIKVLELSQESMGNAFLSQSIQSISRNVIRGESLSRAMREAGIFPPLVLQMIAAGEGTGRLDELLGFVSGYYENQVKYALKNLITYIEPVLIFVLGLSVLFIALAVFLPMWNLIQLFR